MGAGAWYLFQVLFVPKRPGEHVCQIEVIAQSMNPTLQPTSSVLQVRAIAEVPHIQVVTILRLPLRVAMVLIFIFFHWE